MTTNKIIDLQIKVFTLILINMCLGLCCGFVVVSMETEHNFEHNTYITVAQ